MILTSGDIILAGGKIILAGGKIILAGGDIQKITRGEILFTDSQIQSLDADWSSPNDPAISSYIKKFSEFYSAKMYVCIYDTYDIIYSGKQIKKISFFNF